MRSSSLLHDRRNAAACWLRLLLVLVLAADLVSAPLHRHHHDSGVDGALWAADLAHQVTAFEPHNEDGGERNVFHSTSTLRATVASASVDDMGTGAQTWVALPAVFLRLLTPPDRSSTAARAPGNELPPLRPVPVSRPPEGRAQPVRA